MLEVVRIFGELGKTGWRPLRTIEFASWLVPRVSILQRVDLNWIIVNPTFRLLLFLHCVFDSYCFASARTVFKLNMRRDCLRERKGRGGVQPHRIHGAC